MSAAAAARGRGSRRKGADAERELVAFLRGHGFADATRRWQSAQSPDAGQRAVDVTFAGMRCQCKRRAKLETLHRWLSGVDVCFLRADGKPWLALVPADWLLAVRLEGTLPLKASTPPCGCGKMARE